MKRSQFPASNLLVADNDAMFRLRQGKDSLALIVEPGRRSNDPEREWMGSQIDGIIGALAEINPPLNHTGEEIIILAGKRFCFRLIRRQNDMMGPQTERCFSTG